MTFPEIKSILENQFPDFSIEEDLDARPNAVLVKPDNIIAILSFLRNHEEFYFDSLSCVTGIDNGPEVGSMEIIYNLYSISFDLHLMVKVFIARSKPEISTVSNLWRTADWHEREIYDLLGVSFEGHPDLRRILLPADWEGFPLRKDYQEQEKYHGVTVKYEESKPSDN